MRRINRLPLSARAREMLEARTRRVADSTDRAGEVRETWRDKRSAAWDDIREILQTMSTGMNRCMYCEDSAATDIEHFYPKNDYPERAFDWTNYLWACSACNSNYKRSQFPTQDARPLLIDPTSVDPSEFIDFSPSTGKWVAKRKCREGQESIRVFGLARFAQDRQDAWRNFQDVLRGYSRLQDDEARVEVRARLSRAPFSGVLASLLRFAKDPRRRKHIESDVLEVLDTHPELHAIFEA